MKAFATVLGLADSSNAVVVYALIVTEQSIMKAKGYRPTEARSC